MDENAGVVVADSEFAISWSSSESLSSASTSSGEKEVVRRGGTWGWGCAGVFVIELFTAWRLLMHCSR